MAPAAIKAINDAMIKSAKMANDEKVRIENEKRLAAMRLSEEKQIGAQNQQRAIDMLLKHRIQKRAVG